jgi:hypothetical protein
VLDAYFGSHDYAFDAWGYTTDLDLAYQSTITGLVSFLDHVPYFQGLRQRAPILEALPPALGALTFDDRHEWREHWRDEASALQSEMVAALRAAGIPRPIEGGPVPGGLLPEHSTGGEVDVPLSLSEGTSFVSGGNIHPAIAQEQSTTSAPRKASAATRRKEHKQKLARQYEANGMKRVEIARRLELTPRRVFDLLKESQDGNNADPEIIGSKE